MILKKHIHTSTGLVWEGLSEAAGFRNVTCSTASRRILPRSEGYFVQLSMVLS